MPHIHENIDFTACVYIVHKDKVLIRLHDKYNLWISVGGHIELDEDANTAVLREVKEEVGLEVTLIPPPHALNLPNTTSDYTELIPPYFLNIHDINEHHKHHELVFVAKSDSDTVIPENSNDKWMWLTKDEVNNHTEINPTVKYYALTALDALAN